jgi:hypothetical protein
MPRFVYPAVAALALAVLMAQARPIPPTGVKPLDPDTQ